MTDIKFFHTPDGGEIEYIGGVATLDDGLYASVYLSFFGGNERDSGIEADLPKEWWGNKGEALAERRYRSELQYLLNTLPLTPENLPRFEAAALADLAWFIETKTATLVTVTCRMPALRTIGVEVGIEIDGRRIPFVFTRTAAQIAAAQQQSSSLFGQLAFDQPDQSAHLMTTL
jgi:phage gp46-like protein